VAVGFGIKTAVDARAVAAYADGVVVGSAVVERVRDAEPGCAAERVAAFVAELRAGLDA
jgi:tryptophan synthase alpha chain